MEAKILKAKKEEQETLESYISSDKIYTISNKALYTGFQHRSKVEFLKFFIV